MSLAVALATPLGAFICLAFVGNMSAATLGNLLAFTGGSLLYIAAAERTDECFRSVRPNSEAADQISAKRPDVRLV